MTQGLVVVAAIAAALGYLGWYYFKGRKKKPSCPDCVIHEKIAAARKRSPAK